MMTRAHLFTLAIVALLGSGACLDDKGSHVDCGQGDAFNYAGADYCIYAAAIIIEGFDCPAAVPFGHETGELLICGPSNNPPEGGWDDLVQEWETHGNPGGDVSQPETLSDTSQPETTEETTPDTADTNDAADTTPTPGLCVDGLAPGACWDASQCPAGWLCDGAAPGCTPCVDCPEPIPGVAGTCRPDPGADALGLVGWPGFEGAAGDVPVVMWWIDSAFYTLLECPSFTLELRDGSGVFAAGPAESACSAAASAPTAAVVVRPGPAIDTSVAVVVRARGRYRTGCFSLDPAECTGQVDLLSNEVELRGP